MRLLPSEQAAAMKKAIEKFNSTGQLTIEEPCDCGNQVRHNNGGNYHDIIRLARDKGQTLIMEDTTSELEPPAEWEECNDPEAVISKLADWL